MQNMMARIPLTVQNGTIRITHIQNRSMSIAALYSPGPILFVVDWFVVPVVRIGQHVAAVTTHLAIVAFVAGVAQEDRSRV